MSRLRTRQEPAHYDKHARGEVALQGKIDRVDISADGTRLRIVDTNPARTA